MKKAFTRGAYSFHPTKYHPAEPEFYIAVRRKGTRSGHIATMSPASDGKTWVVCIYGGGAIDARPSFREACDLVMARLPMDG